jgi:hypothetical protein
MPTDSVAWTVAVRDSVVEPQEQPREVVIEAVALLFQYSINNARVAAGARAGYFLLPYDIMSLRLGSFLNEWASRLSKRGDASKPVEEFTLVKTDEDARHRDFQNELELAAIIANPELAEHAFPNPVLRRTIVPLLADFRKLTESKSVED